MSWGNVLHHGTREGSVDSIFRKSDGIFANILVKKPL